MEISKGQQELNEYTLTLKEMAQYLGISTNALKCRLKRGNKDNLKYRFVDGKRLFKRLRGNIHSKTPTVRPPGRWHEFNKKKKKDWSNNRRGVTHIGEGNYPNEAFKNHNELKILNRIQKNVPQYVLDRINPRLLSLAQKEFKEDNKIRIPEAPKWYGGPLNEMGRMRQRNYEYHRARQNYYNPDTSFSIRGNQRGNPYDIYNSEASSEPQGYEIDHRDLPRDDTRPTFKNKVEEAIYDAKKKSNGY
mgnify:FL=1